MCLQLHSHAFICDIITVVLYAISNTIVGWVEVFNKLLGLGLVFFIKWMIHWFQGQVQSFRPLVPWIKDPRHYEAHWLWVQGGADFETLIWDD